MNVGVDAPSRHQLAFAGDNLRGRADDGIYARLYIWVARLAYGEDAAVFDADVGLDDASVVQNKGVGYHRVHGAFAAGHL